MRLHIVLHHARQVVHREISRRGTGTAESCQVFPFLFPVRAESRIGIRVSRELLQGAGLERRKDVTRTLRALQLLRRQFRRQFSGMDILLQFPGGNHGHVRSIRAVARKKKENVAIIIFDRIVRHTGDRDGFEIPQRFPERFHALQRLDVCLCGFR